MTRTFRERAREVIKDYIRAVVLLDDKWPPGGQRPLLDEEPAPAIIEDAEVDEEQDDKQLLNLALLEEGPHGATPDGLPEEDDRLESEGELVDIQDAVIDKGIAFTGLRYEAANVACKRRAEKLALRSDVLILDWNLAGADEGEEAMGIIRYLEQRQSGPRFIYVFTGNSTIDGISRKIQEHFDTDAIDASASDFHRKDFAFAIRIKDTALKPDGGDTAAPAGETEQDTSDALRQAVSEGSESGEVEGAQPPEATESAVAVAPVQVTNAPDSHLRVEASALMDDAIAALVEARLSLMELAMIELTTRHSWHLSPMFERLGRKHDASLLAEHLLEQGPVDLLQPGATIHEVLFDEWRSRLTEVAPERPLEILSEEGLSAYLRHLGEELPELPVAPPEVVDAARLGPKEQTPEQKRTFRTYKKELVAALTTLKGRLDPAFHAQLTPASNPEVGSLSERLAGWLQSIEAARTLPFRPGDAACDTGLLASGLFAALAGRKGDPQLEYLRLQALFAQRAELPSRITQGTVLLWDSSEGAGGEEDNTSEYLVCVTPLCDAYRPEKLGGVLSFRRFREIDAHGLASARGTSLDAGTALVIEPRGGDKPLLLARVYRPHARPAETHIDS